MSKIASLNASNSFRLILLAGALATTVACSSTASDKTATTASNSKWTCAPSDVPSGQVMRCTTVSNVASAPTPPSTGGGDITVKTFGVPSGGDTGAPSSSGSTSDSTGTSDTSDSSSTDSADSDSADSTTQYECTPGDTSSECPDSDTVSSASGSSSGSTPDSASTPGLPTECSDADMKSDLSYCAGPAPAPPKPGPMSCTKDMKTGEVACETAPTCGAGTHASTCGACVEDGAADDCVSPEDGGCWVTGGGFIVPQTDNANFGGNAKQMKKGGVSGHWNHVDHATMNHLNGRPQYLYCRYAPEAPTGGHWGKKGLASNQVYFGGEAKWGPGGGADGFWFDVVAEDHGKGHQSAAKGEDAEYYHLTVRVMDDPKGQVGGAIVYEAAGSLVGGKITIHPSNNGHPGIQYPPPAWVAMEPGH